MEIERPARRRRDDPSRRRRRDPDIGHRARLVTTPGDVAVTARDGAARGRGRRARDGVEGVDWMCALYFIIHARARRARDVARDARRRARGRRGSYRQRNRRQPTAIRAWDEAGAGAPDAGAG